ncbi:LptA/OstA family protein [Limibacillus halophilus]|uniref:Lipopolysaccharide export system protein LptA n=1 Tax=Limibacillus halophilus TaxID=1579333 RepID=A0A839SPX7_9PROT|nr:LptA/OstA family protein [Limibacillus halophilus]MBB3063989.1 lipopolysaccharide export system protein LptA [Limibacillus halophilus]
MTGPLRTAWGLLIGLLLLTAGDAVAQSFGLGGQSGPLEITADQGIEWNRDQKQYIARGNARAAQGSTEVRADELIAYYQASDDKTVQVASQIYRIEARGNVRITTDREQVKGDRAVYDLKKDSIIISGSDVSLKTESELITATKSLEYDEANKIAVARGDATVVRGDQRVAADLLRAFLVEASEHGKEGKDLVIDRVEAEGDVRVSTPKDFARGDSGVYYARNELATLEGNVRITSDGNQLNGGFAEVNLATGVSKLKGSASGSGQVRGLLIPGSAPSGTQ